MDRIKKIYVNHKVEIAVIAVTGIVFVVAKMAAEQTAKAIFAQNPYIRIDQSFFDFVHDNQIGK